MKYMLTAIYLIFSTGGMFLFKLGGDSLKLSLSKGIEFKVGYLTFTGLVCYVVSFLLWQKLLATYDLTYIVPLTTGVSQIIILCMGIFAFHEKVNWTSIIGIALIICGVVLVTIAKR